MMIGKTAAGQVIAALTWSAVPLLAYRPHTAASRFGEIAV